MQNILVVDDEEDIRELLEYNLKQEKYAVTTVEDGPTALVHILGSSPPDLIILDWMLPEVDGLDVCRRTKANAHTQSIPVLMLSAKGEEFDKVLALEVGADDYLAKPFGMRELLARVKALLRRVERQAPAAGKEKLQYPGFLMDKERRQVVIDEQNVSLTKTEYDLLWMLAHSPERVYERAQLLYQVWGDDFYGDDRVVDVHIRRLRSKLEAVTQRNLVQTVHGIGYKFVI